MSGFQEMRARLQSEGLIDAGFRLTEAGNERAKAIMVGLRDAEAPCHPDAPRVVWRVDLAKRGRG